MFYPNFQQHLYQPTANPNTLPPQQITQVNGKASVDSIQLAPNSSILVMDTTAPIVWLCVSDGIGKVTSTPYDISEHKDKPPVDVSSFEDRLNRIEQTLKEMEVSNNAKPNSSRFNSKQGN